jgi:hypothetical protein
MIGASGTRLGCFIKYLKLMFLVAGSHALTPLGSITGILVFAGGLPHGFVPAMILPLPEGSKNISRPNAP